jgi:hypothetical protein
MLVINEQRSGAVDPTKIALANMPMGTSPKLVITIDGDSLEEVQSSEAKSQAMARAAQEGYGQGGLADMPQCMAVHAETDEMLTEEQAFQPGIPVKCYRAQFIFNNK